LADGMAEIPGETGSKGNGLVLEDTMIYTSTLPGPPGNVASWWPRYLLFSAVLLGFAYGLCRWLPGMKPVLLARCWLTLSALLGGALIYLWFFTDHAVTQSNLNLLLFNPLWLLCLIGRRWFFVTGVFLLAFGAGALLMTVLPPGQYTADLLAACLPLNVAAAWVLMKDRLLAASGAKLRK